MKRSMLALGVLLLPLWAAAQLEPMPEERGAAGLALALRKLDAGATFMHTTAHPDDEDNGLLVLMSRGRGLRTALLTTTRGDGGQNQIGTELFEALGILRTEELMAMHRLDGAEQYFTRAYEFGYSFSVEETLDKWGKEEILGDIVRLIRTVRPDVIVCLPLGGAGGGQHHQTSARLTKEAFRAAADPNRFPEQIALGLRPWQPLKLYSRVWREIRESESPSVDASKVVSIDTGLYDPVLGRSAHQMGMEARSHHRCQSMTQLRGLPGEHFSRWVLEDSVIPVTAPEKDLFDGVAMGLARFEDFVKGEESKATFLSPGLEAIERHVQSAKASFDVQAPWKALPHLRDGLTAVRRLLDEVRSSGLSDGARFELAHRLSRREQDFVAALGLAHGLGFDAIANRGEVVPGSQFLVDVHLINRSPEPLTVRSVGLALPEGWKEIAKSTLPGELQAHQKVEARFEVSVASDAELSRPYWQRNPDADRYDLVEPRHFGLPATPPAVRAVVAFESGDVEAVLEKPVQHRYNGPWVGEEKQAEVAVLPRLSLTLTPPVVVAPLGLENRTRAVSVNVVHKGSEPGEGSVRLEVPPGFAVSPSEAKLAFRREDEAVTVKFEVTPPAGVRAGAHAIRAVASLGGKDYREGFQTIAYHHIHTRHLFRPAEARFRALDLKVEPVTVGYVMGVGDDVPDAIRQLGAELTLLGEKELAEADLSRWDIIITGIRAYASREDLRAYNHRLLDYVENGGTLFVQYNRQEWDLAQWGPYPSKISQNRITVEEAPIRILHPSHALFTSPNPVSEADWKGWVQERGTYFLGERDERYRDLLASEDPWEYNQGEKRGMLVEARYGKGRWIYCGLTLFRQLPEGVPDAYKLLANILALPRTSTPPSSGAVGVR
jgi:LmbE family N-acetylglucosaminyl deacetylase